MRENQPVPFPGSIDRVFPFAQAADAYRYFASRAHLGKVVISLEETAC